MTGLRQGKRRLFRWRSVLWLFAIAALVVVLRTVPLREIIAALLRLQAWQIGVLILLNAIIILLLSGRWWVILASLGHRLPYGRLATYRQAAFAVTYFTPGPQFGGEPLQVHLLRQRHHLPAAAATAAVAVEKSLDLLVNFAFLVVGAFVIMAIGIDFQVAPQVLLGFALLLLALPVGYLAAVVLGVYPVTRLLSLWPAPDRSLRLQRILIWMQASEEQVSHFFRRRPRPLALALGLAVVTWTAMVGEYWLAARFLGLPYTLGQAVAALTAARLAYLLPLPAGLGALEASQVFAANTLAQDPAAGAALALLIRGRDVVLALVGGWLAAHYLAAEASTDGTP